MRHLLFLIGLAGLLVVSASCESTDGQTGEDSELVVTAEQNGRSVTLHRGQTLAILLQGNPTTGYQWTLAYHNPAFLRELSSTYEPDSDAVGAGGTYTFRFEALQEGLTSLALHYQRTWEPEPLEIFTLRLHILNEDSVARSAENPPE